MRNERGYTLVITLLMITLIFIVSATFIATSLNSANQNRQTGSKYMATQIAEMGIVYVKESLDANIDKDETDVDDVLNIVEDTMRNIEGTNKIIDPEKSNRFFTIKDDELTRNENIITLSFLSEGTADNKKAPLEATLMIVVPLDDSTSGGGGMIDIGSIEEIVDGRDRQDIEKPSGSHAVAPASGEAYIFPSGTVFPQQIKLENNTAVITEGDATFRNTISPSNDSIIAVYGDALIRNKINQATGFQFLISGKADTDNSIYLGKNSIIKAAEFNSSNSLYLVEDAHFITCGNSHFKYTESNKDSQINICGDAKFDNNGINANEGTRTNIKGNADFGQVTLNDNATLNVGKKLTTNRLVLNSSKIKVFGDTDIVNASGGSFSNSEALFAGNLTITGSGISSINGSFIQVFGDSKFSQINGISNSTVKLFGDFTVEKRLTVSEDSTVEVFGNTILGTGSGGSGSLIAHGDITLLANKDQFSSLKICVKGNINWTENDKKIVKYSDAESCNNIDNKGIYQMPNLIKPNIPDIPDKSDYFQDCTESCVLNDKSNKVEIDLEEVTY